MFVDESVAHVRFSGQAAAADPAELAETVANVIGTLGLPLPQSPSSAGFAYRDDCRSSLTFARHVMFQEDIADAINGVRYVTDLMLKFAALVGLFAPTAFMSAAMLHAKRAHFQIFVPTKQLRARAGR